MRELVPYTRYKKTSSFIREGIELLLKREDEQPSGWTAGRPRRGWRILQQDRQWSTSGATFAGRRRPWGHAVQPTAPVRSTERPAGGVMPEARQELAGGHLAGGWPFRWAVPPTARWSCIDLVYYHGKSVKEVAEIIGIAEATVKTRMFYARKKLAALVATA
jgi:Arc/MetJ-type ribon-helix-helix transcriptional regulator